jgi:putative oxidoreductase
MITSGLDQINANSRSEANAQVANPKRAVFCIIKLYFVSFHNMPKSFMNKLMFSLFQTSGAVGPLLLRVFLAVVMFPHGAQKVVGWFGGSGFASSMVFLTDKMGVPAIFAFLAILTEFLGPIALLFGFLTRVAAFAIGFDMLVAAILVHVHFGFFMNWLGKQKGEGIEFDLLLWAIALALIIQGAGAYSLDRVISAKLQTAKTNE